MTTDRIDSLGDLPPEPITLEQLQLQAEALFPGSLDEDLARSQLVGDATDLLEKEVQIALQQDSVLRRVFGDPYKSSRDTMRFILEQLRGELRLPRDFGTISASVIGVGDIQIFDRELRKGETLSPQNIKSTNISALKELFARIFSSSTREEEIRRYHHERTQTNPIISASVEADIQKDSIPFIRVMSQQFNGIGGVFERLMMREQADPFLERRVQALVHKHRGGVFMDLGCGPALEVRAALAAGAGKVIAIDNSEFGVAKAKAVGEAAKINDQASPVEPIQLNFLQKDLPTELGEVDAAWCLHVIDAMGSPQEIHRFFTKVRDSLKPGGEFLIVTEEQPIFVRDINGREISFSLNYNILSSEENYNLMDETAVGYMAQKLGIDAKILESVETTYELAVIISEAIKNERIGLKEIIRYGQTGEEVKAMLALAGFEIVYYEANLETSSFKYSRGKGDKRGGQICVLGRKKR